MRTCFHGRAPFCCATLSTMVLRHAFDTKTLFQHYYYYRAITLQYNTVASKLSSLIQMNNM